jgi:predicted secreted protein
MVVNSVVVILLQLVSIGAFSQDQQVIEDKTKGKSSTTAVRVNVGEEFILQLYSQRTGETYAWHNKDSASYSQYLRYVGQTYQNLTNIPGAPGVQLMHFRAIKPGKALIKFYYTSRLYPNSAEPPEKRFEVTIGLFK